MTWSRRRFVGTLAGGASALAAPGRVAWGQSTPPDVIVLGAGLAGLNATVLLEDAGFSVQILEGTQRVGGRLYTASEEEVPGHPELGGSGIGSFYARLIDAANRFDVGLEGARPRTESQPGDVMYHVRGAAIQPGDWAAHPLNPFVSKRHRSIPLHLFQFSIYGGEENPFPKGDFEAWQSGRYGDQDISVNDYLERKGVAKQAIKLAAGTNMSYGSNPHDLSVLMGFQSSNMVRSFYTGETGAVAQAGVGGNQRIPEGIAKGLKSEIVFGQHVAGIRSAGDGVEVTTRGGEVFRANYCICTFPFSALRHVRIDPYLEGRQAEAVDTIGYTPVFQAHYVPVVPYWEKDGMPPSMWTDRAPGRFMAQRNDPNDPERVTSCLAFVNGEMAKYLDGFSPERASQLILADLAAMRPATEGALKLVKVWSWNRNPFAGGAYAYWKPGQITRFANEMRRPWKRIHFAGEHTAVLNRGMEGAMESGERAAFEIMKQLI